MLVSKDYSQGGSSGWALQQRNWIRVHLRRSGGRTPSRGITGANIILHTTKINMTEAIIGGIVDQALHFGGTATHISGLCCMPCADSFCTYPGKTARCQQTMDIEGKNLDGPLIHAFVQRAPRAYSPLPPLGKEHFHGKGKAQKRSVKTVWSFGTDVTLMEPWWRRMIWRERLRPMPVPPFFVVKNGTKIFS